MAAEWFYAANGQQTGPIELDALQQMLDAGSVARTALVFGPSLTQWTPAEQVPALAGAGGSAAVSAVAHAGPVAAGASMLLYRGVDTDPTGLSAVAMGALRQTKPWVRFVAIMTFIGAGFMAIGGAGMFFVSTLSSRGAGVPAWLGGIYIAMALLYIVPGVLLNRYASGIASLMQSQRMSDVEKALGAQKSFWKFVGMMLIVMMCLYVVAIVVVFAVKM